MSEPRYPYLHVPAQADEVEWLSYTLFELGASGVEERDASTLSREMDGVMLIASFADHVSAEEARRALGRDAEIVDVIGDGWRDGWRAFFKPRQVGPKLWVRPSWEPLDAPHGHSVIVVDPGRAFGSGTHESTRLVLGQLGEHLEPGQAVLDVGCGSGILSVGACLLGASRVIAVDIDPDSASMTRENAQINGVSDRIEASTLPAGRVEGRFPLVLANIEAWVLRALSADLAAKTAPGGTLILSGVLAGQEQALLEAFPEFRCVHGARDGAWVAPVLKRTDG